jgi:hypothetical protein
MNFPEGDKPVSQQEARLWEQGDKNFNNFVRDESKRLNPMLKNYGRDNLTYSPETTHMKAQH